MKRMLILAVTMWLGIATVHAQVNSPTNAASTPTNAASTATGAIVPSGQGVTGATGGGFRILPPVLVPCPFGVSVSATLTAFGCASDPLSAPTYQIPAEAGAVIPGPVGSNAQTLAPNAALNARGAGGGFSSSAGCLGAIPTRAGGASASDLFGGSGGC